MTLGRSVRLQFFLSFVKIKNDKGVDERVGFLQKRRMVSFRHGYNTYIK